MSIIKDTKKYFLTPTGADKKNDTFNSQLNYNVNGVIQDEKYILYNTLSIVHAEIPYSFYVINLYNNILSLSTGDIVIDKGNYNASSLMKAINAKLPTHMVMTYNSFNGKFTITYNNSFSIKDTTTMSSILGLERNKEYHSIASKIDFPFPANLLGTKNLYIKTNFIISNLNLNTNDYETLACIPVNVEPFSIILFNNYSNSSHIIKNKTLDNIEIRIYDDDNNLVNFNNVDWSITIEINSFLSQDFNNSTLSNYLNNSI